MPFNDYLLTSLSMCSIWFNNDLKCMFFFFKENFASFVFDCFDDKFIDLFDFFRYLSFLFNSTIMKFGTEKFHSNFAHKN